MKIGFFAGYIREGTNGGGCTFQGNLIEALKSYKSSHELVLYYTSEKNLYENTDCIKFVNLKFEKKEFFKKKFLHKKKKYISMTLNEVVLRDKIDLVYFITPCPDKLEVPFIMTIWDLAQREHPYFPEVSVSGWTFDAREDFYGYVIPRASYTVIGNEEGKRQICKYYNANENLVKTIPIPTPLYVYNTDEDKSILEKYSLCERKYIFYPAQFWPHKNHIRLVKELKKLKDNGSDLKLVFSGSDMGNENYIKQHVKKLGLENDVIFAGFVTREQVVALYKNAFALTFASYFDPDNLPPLEAMALSCPVICSDTKGMKQQLCGCALFFNQKTGENFAKNLEKLKDKKLRDELIENGKTLALQYSTENYINKMFAIMDDFAQIRECWSSEEKYVHL